MTTPLVGCACVAPLLTRRLGHGRNRQPARHGSPNPGFSEFLTLAASSLPTVTGQYHRLAKMGVLDES